MERATKQIDTLFEKARERGLRPMWTHYYRVHKGEKVLGATTCILLDNSGRVMSRGAAVVSLKDVPSKVVGRALSLKRAFAAAASETNYDCSTVPTKGVVGLPRHISKSMKTPLDFSLTEIELSRVEARRKKLEQPVLTSAQA